MRTEGGRREGRGGAGGRKEDPRSFVARGIQATSANNKRATTLLPPYPPAPCPLSPVRRSPSPTPPQPPSWSLAIFTFALQIRGGGKRDRGFCARRFARRDAINERRSVRGRRAPAVYTCYTLARTFPPAARYNPLTINKVLMKWNIRRHVQASPSIRQRTMSRLHQRRNFTLRVNRLSRAELSLLPLGVRVELDRLLSFVCPRRRSEVLSSRERGLRPTGAYERNDDERIIESARPTNRPSFTRVIVARGSSACALAAHLIKRD